MIVIENLMHKWRENNLQCKVILLPALLLLEMKLSTGVFSDSFVGENLEKLYVKGICLLSRKILVQWSGRRVGRLVVAC